MSIFLVAYFKYDKRGPEHGFDRMHLQTFWSKLEDAKEFSQRYFCDEAGWYEGILIEERKEGQDTFKGIRIFMLRNQDITFYEVPEPEYTKNCINLIGC